MACEQNQHCLAPAALCFCKESQWNKQRHSLDSQLPSLWKEREGQMDVLWSPVVRDARVGTDVWKSGSWS